MASRCLQELCENETLFIAFDKRARETQESTSGSQVICQHEFTLACTAFPGAAVFFLDTVDVAGAVLSAGLLGALLAADLLGPLTGASPRNFSMIDSTLVLEAGCKSITGLTVK